MGDSMDTSLPWARKYRPSSFDDYLGNEVKNRVMGRLKNHEDIPNTIMLFGTRGTGKTSMARLIAKEIQCLNPIDGHSCGMCDMCREMDRYITSTEAGEECAGLTEVDAATNTGKDYINEVIEDALIPPLPPANKKILIFDECHMLSPSAQNSILKITEEPPKHLVFILCTTDPERVLKTLHSRMQMAIEVKKKSIDEIVDRLIYIAKQESVKTSEQALRVLAKRCDRIPRECINKFEAIAKNNGKTVTMAEVMEELGDMDSTLYLEFYKCANLSLEAILEYTSKIKASNRDIKEFVKGLMRFTMDTIYIKYGIAIEDFSPEQVKKAKSVFKMYSMSECDMLLQIVEAADNAITQDDTKNELVIINTAIRVSKLKLLANGLGGQSGRAVDENTASVRTYSRLVEDEQRSRIDNMQMQGLTRENIIEMFPEASEVKGSIGVEDESFNSELGDTNIKLNASDEASVGAGVVGIDEKESQIEMLRRMFQESGSN